MKDFNSYTGGDNKQSDPDGVADMAKMMAKAFEGKGEAELRAVLTMLIGECAEVFERLPVVQDAGIMRNILYSGVWTRYNAALAAKARKGEKAGEP